MGILNDREITRLSVEGWKDSDGEIHHMIEPFAENKKRPGKISYGVSSYGYDWRLGDEFHIFTGFVDRGPGPLHETRTIDPKNFSTDVCHKVEAWEEDGYKIVIIPPRSFALGVSLERFCLPRNVLGVCLGKSTYARCGLDLPMTPLEPQWRGHLTAELCNTTGEPMKIYVGEGIGQIFFLVADSECDVSYSDRKGKYQEQPAVVVMPRVD